jgi:alcohol dehydrogenase
MLQPIRREQFPDSAVVALHGPYATGIFVALGELGVSDAMIVCGENLGKSDAVRSLMAGAPEGVKFSIFDQVEPDPSDETIKAGGLAACDAGAQAVVAVGGGSSMDAAKAIAAEATDIGWIAAQDQPGQPTAIERDPLPIVAVPTTAGTASEVTPFSVITFAASRRKLVLNHPTLLARFAVLDPALLVSGPRSVRVAAGMDALTHAVESFVSKQATPATRARCREAIELIGRFLRRVASDANDMEAEEGMQRAAFLAGLAFSKTRLGIVHATALPLSALFHVPHGLANAILLPYGMRFNHLADAEGFAQIARALGADVAAMDDHAAAQAAAETVEALADDIGAPRRMSDVGVAREAIERMADDAMPSAHLKVNPHEVAREDIIALYDEAF